MISVMDPRSDLDSLFIDVAIVEQRQSELRHDFFSCLVSGVRPRVRCRPVVAQRREQDHPRFQVSSQQANQLYLHM